MEKRIMTNGFVSTALARSAITRSVTGTKINVSRRFIFFFFCFICLGTEKCRAGAGRLFISLICKCAKLSFHFISRSRILARAIKICSQYRLYIHIHLGRAMTSLWRRRRPIIIILIDVLYAT